MTINYLLLLFELLFSAFHHHSITAAHLYPCIRDGKSIIIERAIIDDIRNKADATLAAARNGDIEGLKAIHHSFYAVQHPTSKKTALEEATRYAQLEIVQFLHQQGCNPCNYHDPKTQISYLDIAAETLEAHLKGITPLSKSSLKNLVAIIKFYKELNVPFNTQSLNQQTTDFLRQRGFMEPGRNASKNKQKKEKAKRKKKEQPRSILDAVEQGNIAYIEACTEESLLPYSSKALQLATLNGHVEIVRYLCNRCCSGYFYDVTDQISYLDLAIEMLNAHLQGSQINSTVENLLAIIHFYKDSLAPLNPALINQQTAEFLIQHGLPLSHFGINPINAIPVTPIECSGDSEDLTSEEDDDNAIDTTLGTGDLVSANAQEEHSPIAAPADYTPLQTPQEQPAHSGKNSPAVELPEMLGEDIRQTNLPPTKRVCSALSNLDKTHIKLAQAFASVLKEQDDNKHNSDSDEELERQRLSEYLRTPLVFADRPSAMPVPNDLEYQDNRQFYEESHSVVTALEAPYVSAAHYKKSDRRPYYKRKSRYKKRDNQ